MIIFKVQKDYVVQLKGNLVTQANYIIIACGLPRGNSYLDALGYYEKSAIRGLTYRLHGARVTSTSEAEVLRG